MDRQDYDLAIAEFSKAIRLKPGNMYARVDRGLAYADKGDWDKAIADYNEAIRLSRTVLGSITLEASPTATKASTKRPSQITMKPSASNRIMPPPMTPWHGY